jgi:hypothetical protein
MGVGGVLVRFDFIEKNGSNCFAEMAGVAAGGPNLGLDRIGKSGFHWHFQYGSFRRA